MSRFAVLLGHYSLLIAIVGAWVLWQASLLREGPGYAAVGPKTFPYIVGLGMLVSGIALFLERARAPGKGRAVAEAAEPLDWVTLAAVAAVTAPYVALYLPLGFVIATTLFLPACGWALGSRAPVRDVIVGVALALVTYVAFTRFLGLELPGGPIDESLRALINIGRAGPGE